MARRFCPGSCLLVVLALLSTGVDRHPTPVGSAPPPAAVADPLGGVFVPNLGQWPVAARFAARFDALTVQLEEHGFLWALATSGDGGGARGAAVRMQFAGSSPSAIVGERQLVGGHDYLVGERSRWRTGVARFGGVRYVDLYPGVDLVAYEKDGGFEYDLVLAPGAALAQVDVHLAGALALRPAADGALWIDTAVGPVRQSPPRTFAIAADGTRREVACEVVVRGPDRFGFAAPTWSGAEALCIDPGLSYSTLIGSSLLQGVMAVAVDANGVITVAGTTNGWFPTTPGAFATLPNGSYEIFVGRLDPRLVGSAQLVYGTFVGGTATDELRDAVVDAAGVVTLVGATTSTDFPVTGNAFAASTAGGSDAVVVRLDPGRSGSAQLVYSTYLGGTGADDATAVAVDGAGVITVAGTARAGFPTTASAYDTTPNGIGDAFVTRLDPAQSGAAQLRWSTLLGGRDLDKPLRLAVDGNGVVTLVGYTSSPDLPTVAAYDSTFGGVTDAFVARLDPRVAGTAQLVYATYLGDNGFEGGNALAVDPHGVITVAGGTGSATFPVTPGAYDTTPNASSDAFVTRLDPRQVGAQQLVWSTRLGGAGGSNEVAAMAMDAAGVVTVVGTTSSTAFPTTAGAYDPTFHGNFDAFVSRLDPGRTGAQQLVYSTCLGSAVLSDRPWAVALDALGGAVVAGITSSFDFPTTAGAYSTTHTGSFGDGFVARLDLLPTGVRAFGRSTPGCRGPVLASVTSMPRLANADFRLWCSGAPPTAPGVLLLGWNAASVPVPMLGAELWVDPATLVQSAAVTSTADGAASFLLAIPNQPTLVGLRLAAQFAWVGPNAPPPCPASGVSASHGLEITIQP